MAFVRVACRAMATRFEMALYGDDPVRLRAAGEEALAEIQRLEAQLSFYRPSSEISRINQRAAEGPVRVEPGLFRLLLTARRLHADTGGAFDVTVAPLMRCWGFVNDTGRRPEPDALAAARARTGMHLVRLDEAAFTVAFARPGVQIDLGGIGKGYALDEAAHLLREAGISRALLHGGTSTVVALGTPPDAPYWTIAIARPGVQTAEPEGDDLLAQVHLADAALSVSAVWGKAFEVDGTVYGHVLDPRRGRPVEGAVLAAVVCPSATEADARSTALLVEGRAGLDRLARHTPPLQGLVVDRAAGDRGGTLHRVGAPSQEGRGGPVITLHPSAAP